MDFAVGEAFGLEFAEFGCAFVEEAMGLRSGSIHGELEAGFGVALHRIFRHSGERFFDLGAAAEAPHGSSDFVGEVLFENAGRGQFGLEILSEFVVYRLFAGADEVADGEEAEGDGVLGGDRFTGLCAGSASVGFFGDGL